MDLSRIRSPLSLFPSRKPVWPSPESSIGTLHGVVKGKYKYWEAIGPARDAYEAMCDDIQQILNSSCGPVRCSSVLIYDIYMVGRTEESAIPHIMFSCKHPESRKQAMAAVRKSRILNRRAPGMDLGHWACPPHIVNLQLLASYCAINEVRPDNENVSYSIRRVFHPGSPSDTLALQVVQERAAEGHIKSQRTATIGALVELCGQRYYLAPEHLVSGVDRLGQTLCPDVPQWPDDSDSDCEFGAFSSDLEVTDEDVDFMSLYSLSPPPSDIDSDPESFDTDFSDDDELEQQPITTFAYQSSLSPTMRTEQRPLPSTSILNIDNAPLNIEVPIIASKDLDYVLIEVNEKDDCISHLPVLSRATVSSVPSGSTIVTTVTGTGRRLNGTISGRPSYARLPHTSSFQKTFEIEFDGPLLPGDSGSAVRDGKSGMVYGHIIAGSIESNVAYIIPSEAILADLEDFEPHHEQCLRDNASHVLAHFPALAMMHAAQNIICELFPSLSSPELETDDRRGLFLERDTTADGTRAQLTIRDFRPQQAPYTLISWSAGAIEQHSDTCAHCSPTMVVDFDLETAGPVESIPGLIINGTCDFADLLQKHGDHLTALEAATPEYSPDFNAEPLVGSRHKGSTNESTCPNALRPGQARFVCNLCNDDLPRTRGTLKRHINTVHATTFNRTNDHEPAHGDFLNDYRHTVCYIPPTLHECRHCKWTGCDSSTFFMHEGELIATLIHSNKIVLELEILSEQPPEMGYPDERVSNHSTVIQRCKWDQCTLRHVIPLLAHYLRARSLLDGAGDKCWVCCLREFGRNHHLLKH